MSTSLISIETPPRRVEADARTKRFYAPELDILRFGAFLLVFCRHVSNALGGAKEQTDRSALTSGPLALPTHASGPLPHANWEVVRESLQAFDFGVCLFFFLSAFLITRLLLMERERTGKIDIRGFYIRRCLRIWPLYFTFLALIFLASLAFPVLHVDRSRFLAAIFFVANWAAVLHGWSGIAIQPLWSISVEEQFYVVWPVLSRFGKSAVTIVSSACIALSIGTLYYLGHRQGSLVTHSWPNTFVQVLFLAGGALTACYSFPEDRQLSILTRCVLAGIGLGLWIIASAGFHIVRTQSPGSLDLITGYLLVLAGTFLLFTAVAGWKGAQFHPRFITLGKISYGLYVFHVACLLLMERFVAEIFVRFHHASFSAYGQTAIAAALGLTLTLLFSLLSYRYLESPFLRLKERFTVVNSRPT